MSTFVFSFPTGAGVESATTVAEGDVDHVTLALARLKEQHKYKDNIEKLVRLLVEPTQDLETALVDLLLKRDVNTAEGQQLDDLGSIVGVIRFGLSDDDYRKRIRARILVNRSKGRISELITIARLVIDDESVSVVLDNQGYSAYVIRLLDATVDTTTLDLLLEYLKLATVAGNRVIVEHVGDTTPNLFVTATFAALSSAVVIGNTTLPVNSTANFPDTGTLQIDTGLAVAETVTYTGKTSTTFTGVSALTQNHVISSGIILVDATSGKGFGNSANASVGGKLIGARD